MIQTYTNVIQKVFKLKQNLKMVIHVEQMSIIKINYFLWYIFYNKILKRIQLFNDKCCRDVNDCIMHLGSLNVSPSQGRRWMLLEVSQHSLALHMHQLLTVLPPLGPPSLVRLRNCPLATLCCILTLMETCTRLSLTHFYNQTSEQLNK